MAILAVLGAIVALGAGLLVVTMLFGPLTPDVRTAAFDSPGLMRMQVPAEWQVAEGEADQDPSHRVIAHVLSFPVTEDEVCTAFGDECTLGGAGVPVGEASVIVTEWTDGTPPPRTASSHGGSSAHRGSPTDGSRYTP
jgi:hypothetical protein